MLETGGGSGRPWGGAPSVGARPRGGVPQGVGRHTIRRLLTWGRRAPGGGALTLRGSARLCARLITGSARISARGSAPLCGLCARRRGVCVVVGCGWVCARTRQPCGRSSARSSPSFTRRPPSLTGRCARCAVFLPAAALLGWGQDFRRFDSKQGLRSNVRTRFLD